MTVQAYGDGDTSYRAAGEWDGVCRLVNAFYEQVANAPEARALLAMHRDGLDSAREKLSVFLCGWLGGPRRYAERFGQGINIPAAHAHLRIGIAERDVWLWCMQRAIDQQPYPPAFKEYLYRQLCVPAQRIVQRCALAEDL